MLCDYFGFIKPQFKVKEKIFEEHYTIITTKEILGFLGCHLVDRSSQCISRKRDLTSGMDHPFCRDFLRYI